MSKFSLNTLAAKLSEKSGLSATEAELFIRNMFDVCHQGLEADKQVKVRWLGTFKVTSVKDRESVDVNTGERIVIEGRDKISFTPDNILKEIVNKPFAQFETVVVNDGVEFDAIDKKFETEEAEETEETGSEEEQAAAEEVAVEELAKQQDSIELSAEPSNEETEMDKAVKSSECIVVASPKTEEETQGVIDFLDTPSSETPSSDVIVIGDETEVATEPATEPTLAQEPAPEPTAPVPVQDVQKEQRIQNDVQKEQEVQKDVQEELKVEEDAQNTEEVEDEIRRHHFILPKYAVVAACIIVLALVGGIGWFAFTYGQMAAQRDHLALQLEQYKAHKAAATKVKTQEQILKEKAREDSLRMLQASEVLTNAEKAGKDSAATNKATQDIAADRTAADRAAIDKAADKAAADKKRKAAEEKQAREELAKKSQQADKASKYDSDPRVRTGAYSIVGVAQTITVADGQSLASISKKYLGPGMECYIEALNGTANVKSGQKIKIPKLELKKKRKQ